MPIEDKQKKDADAPEAGKTKSKPKIPLRLILIGVAAFVVAIGIFSFVMGVFSTSPEAETAATPPAAADSVLTPSTDVTEDQALIEKMEKEIFGEHDSSSGEMNANADVQQAIPPMPVTTVDSMPPTVQIDAEKAQLAQERAELEALRRQLDEKEQRLEKLLAQTDKMETSRVNALAKLYNGMKPAQVAPLLSKLSDEQAIQVLLQMKPASAAKILGAMSPERAASISASMITFTEGK